VPSAIDDAMLFWRADSGVIFAGPVDRRGSTVLHNSLANICVTVVLDMIALAKDERSVASCARSIVHTHLAPSQKINVDNTTRSLV